MMLHKGLQQLCLHLCSEGKLALAASHKRALLPTLPTPSTDCPLSEMQTFWYRRLLMKDSAALLQVEKEVERKVKVSRGSDGRLSRTVEWSGGLHVVEHGVPGRGISLKLLRTVCLPPCCDSTTQPTTTGRSCRCWCSSCASAATTRCDRAS